MATIKYLYENHLKDLQSIDVRLNNHFFCPICLNRFKGDEISRRTVSEGHVWPKYISQQSEDLEAVVLLCKSCNNKSGPAGDAHMHCAQEVMDRKKSGNLGLREITFIRP